MTITNWAIVHNENKKINDMHVMPRADMLMHIASPMCFCKPRLERVRSGWMCGHYAVDGRE